MTSEQPGPGLRGLSFKKCPSQKAARDGASESGKSGLEFVVAWRVRHIAPIAHRVRGSPARPAIQPTRRENGDVQGVPDLKI